MGKCSPQKLEYERRYRESEKGSAYYAAYRKTDKRKEANKAYKKSPKGRYTSHKEEAKRRGIPFKITFKQWWTLWEDSGKWHLRGAKKGHYVMARFGDTGPYKLGNVAIVPHELNCADSNRDPDSKCLTQQAKLPLDSPIN